MPITHHTPLVLASGSAIRARMLKAAGLQFSVVPSSVDEDEIKRKVGKGQQALAQTLARAKTLDVSKGYPDHLTIGADQLCMLGDTIFDKPGSAEAATQQLQQLQGNTHLQLSAVCVARGEEVLWEHVAAAELTMRALGLPEIEAYVAADQPLKSCGAYQYESLGKHLFAEVNGADSTIMGLPVQPLIAQLHERGAISISP